MGKPRAVLALAAAAAALLLSFLAAAVGGQGAGRIQGMGGCAMHLIGLRNPWFPLMSSGQQSIGSADDDSARGLKVYMYIYGLPEKYNKPLKKEPRCLNYMFAMEIFMEQFLLPSVIQILIPRMQFGCIHAIQMCSAIEQITTK
ncbi:hypothetical protein VPH35_054931 [Triticum aestivum]|uniref:Uncharacterized protein n=2 Tax=Triticum TaxID=4564 RepID=A0A077S760_WHEAT|nr:unnamed protein product [Triticum aestivum]VAH83943.1 unnamed protein product [Triticum turgidum subsp. durum]